MTLKSTILDWIKKHDLWVFFTLVFVLMWPKGIEGAAYSMGLISEPPSAILNVLYVLGTPLVAAVIITAVTRGREGLKEFVNRLFRWRVGWRWILVSLVIYPLVALAAFAISSLATGGQWTVTMMWNAGFANIQENAVRIGLNPENTWQIFAILVAVSFIVPIFEEGGWRAFAIPRLQEKYSALVSGLVMGVIWSIWHLPSFFTKGTDHYGMPCLWFLMTIVSISILMVWIMNHTHQSVLMTILFHGSIILAGHFLPTQLAYQTGNTLALWLTGGLLAVIATVVVLYEGPARLVRGKQASMYHPADIISKQTI
jgi:membrane protease YdiL (CAAX protease family)